MARPAYVGSPLYKSRHPSSRALTRYPPSKRTVAWRRELLRVELDAMVARGELVKFTNRNGVPGEFYGLPGSAP